MKKSVIQSLLSATTCLAMMATSPVLAGDYDGVTIDAKLIGGQQYEGLYALISNWEIGHRRLSKYHLKKESL